MKVRLKIISVLLIGLSSLVSADSKLHIMNAWINDAPPMLKHRAGYMVIHNMGDTDIVLESASSDAFETVEFHESLLDGDQVQMRQRKTIKVDAGKTVKFQPGGLHLMLLNKQKELKQGDAAGITLSLANGETIDVNLSVKKADNTEVHNHDHHHHH